MTNIVYPVSPSISLAYDVLNRLTSMVDAVGSTVYGYDNVGQLLSEDGPWANDTVSYSYNNRLRTGLSVLAPNASAWTESYGYDTARRLTSLTSPAGAFSYTLGGASSASPLTRKLTLPNGAYITNTYDSVARLLSTVLNNSTNGMLNSHNYAYNVGNQRTALTNTFGDYRTFTYDAIGQLKTALGKESGGVTNRWQEQFGYAYDAAGNLNYRTNNALIQTFNVNTLNELSTQTRSGTLTVAGTTTSPATNVTVNSANAVLYLDSTFAITNQTLVDGNNTFTAIAKDSYGRQDSQSITVNLPATNTFAYDLNGNMLTNGTEVLVYNDENQLVTNWVAGAWKSEFVYDGKMRRRIERDYAWNGSAWTQTNEIHLIYDGNVILQHRDVNNLPTLTLTRGTDLSGSLQGAGGIGGLLALTENSQLLTQNSQTAHSFYHADGNGNVTCLINASNAVVARAEYDPFGNFLSLSGLKAGVNPYWFSSKPIHWQSGKYDFLYRWYIPQLDRWPNRDPEGEFDGANLFAFVLDDPVSSYDAFGLQRGSTPAPPAPELDSCTQDQRKAIDDAYKKACDRISKCPNSPDCARAQNAAQSACNQAQKPKVRCAKAGDQACSKPASNGQTPCAYEQGGGITLCNRSWPTDGSKCVGNGGPMTLDCTLIHELEHAGANGKNPDDANQLQKCVGCPQGMPHAR